MTWDTSRRRDQLPPDWAQLRKQVFARANHRCEHADSTGQRCQSRATDCDHIQRGNDHTLDNLQGLCRTHHAEKTARESREAQTARYTTAKKRDPEPHPGILT